MFEPSQQLEFALGGDWIAAGQPSETRLLEVVALGARVISLRTEGEDPYDTGAVVSSAGGHYMRFPTRGSDLSSGEFRQRLYDMLDTELARDGRVYFHCGSSNRIGAAWALYHAERKGVTPEAALQMGLNGGMTRLETPVRQILGLSPK